MIDEATLRRVVREEVAKLLPRATNIKVRISVPTCARLYNTSWRKIRDFIDDGSLEAVWHEGGRGPGKGHWMVVTASAEKHPKLGGGIA